MITELQMALSEWQAAWPAISEGMLAWMWDIAKTIALVASVVLVGLTAFYIFGERELRLATAKQALANAVAKGRDNVVVPSSKKH